MNDRFVVDIYEPGNGTARSVRIGQKPARVGRGAICEVQLRTPGLAVIECTLRLDRSGLMLSPWGAGVRVRLNGAPVLGTTLLPESCTLEVGDVELRIEPCLVGQEATQQGSRAAPLDAHLSYQKANPRHATSRAQNDGSVRIADRQRDDKIKPQSAKIARVVEGWNRIRTTTPSTMPHRTAAVAELPTQGLPPVCASTLAYNERASNKTPNSVTTSALAEAGSHDLQTQTSDWLDQDQLAARLAWDRSDESPVAKETEATAPAETLVNHDFDLPSLEDDTSQSDEPTVTTESSPVGRPVLVEPVEASWPSTRFILHSQAVHAAIAKRRQAMASAEKIGLTIPQPPRNYRFGNRTILSGVLLIVGAASAVAVGLTYRMCADGTTAATYDGLLGAEILPRRELTELAQEPIAPWWSTSRNSLALRAAALARSDDPAAVEVVTQVIDRAVAVCPLDPVAALERRRVFSANSEESFSPFQPAREVSSLAFAAELHLKQGHRRRASELLRDGFQIASTGQIELTALSSNEAEERGGLLPLPHEKLCEPLVAVMKAYDLLTREACDNILPPWAPAWLAAARSARQSSQREAQAIVDKLEELPAEYDDMGGTWVQEAAIAEGMVMKGDLQSSAERYRRAIERCGKSAWAGLLWLNLAEVEARRYDTEAAEHAQRMARKAASYGGPEAKIIKRLLRDTHEHRRPATPG